MDDTHASSRSQSHIHTNPIVTNLLQLAIGLLGDLGLKRPPAKQPPHLILNYETRSCPKNFSPTKRTTEERRVALGIFWLSSVYDHRSRLSEDGNDADTSQNIHLLPEN